ncbi:Diadenosine tetraphosphate (Ap4A) hydrolase [Nocardia amikacinitolerans]|nr:Diadenosine tetraphosphate (Ap4A) hydrolase [Nocardia amikacinitolerans]
MFDGGFGVFRATRTPYGRGVNDCVFCRIVAGEAPATKVYEDELLCAFLDIRPVARGHTLVVPKRHAAELEDLHADLGAELFRAGHRIALAMRRSSLLADGANLVMNDGKAAFQTVAHVHLHVVPRRHGDKLSFAKGFLLRRPNDPEGTAAAIRAGLAALARQDDAEDVGTEEGTQA